MTREEKQKLIDEARRIYEASRTEPDRIYHEAKVEPERIYCARLKEIEEMPDD